MDSDLESLFDQLISVEHDRLLKQTRIDLSRKQSELASKGVLAGSAGMRALVELAIGSLAFYASAAFLTLTRVAAGHCVSISSNNERDFTSTLNRYIEAYHGELLGMLTSISPFGGSGAGPKQNGQPYLDELKRESDALMRKFDGEMRLIAVRNDRATGDQNGPGMVFNGYVGVVQTGPGSSATQNIYLDASTIQSLSLALDKIEQLLTENKGSDEEKAVSQTVELIDDARKELKRTEPNSARLKSIMGAIGGTISFLPKLRPAYETVKWAAGLVGVPLP